MALRGTVLIGETSYELAETAGGKLRLTRPDGTRYYVTRGPSRTTCSCPQFVHRLAHLDTGAVCKHIEAIRSL